MSDARLEMLEAENALLRERIARLERELLCVEVMFPVEWRLTGMEQRVLGLLLSRELASRDAIMTALYDGRDEADIKIVDVFVCKLRRKMAPFGLVIETLWGRGYSIAEPTRGDFRRRLQRSRPDPHPTRLAS